MIFIRIDENNMVVYQHFRPFDPNCGLGKSEDELEREGYLVDSIPNAEQIDGKCSVLYFNPQTRELWYEYEDIPPIPLTPEQEVADLKQQVADLNLAMAAIMGGAV